MINNIIHIVSFNVPSPANYGGVIDVFFKIKALHTLGIKVILHNYCYGREPQPELESICYKVYYYPRPKKLFYQISLLPYIVNTRKSKQLLTNLLSDNYPILFEGLHTTYWLNKGFFTNRNILVRAHNIEHNYYSGLAASEKNVFKKLFFKTEAYRLKKYETVLHKANYILSIAPYDNDYFSQKYKNAVLINPFHQNTIINSKTGKGSFVLFQADLSIHENQNAALYLLENVFANLSVSFVIAGRNPSKYLINKVKMQTNAKIEVNPTNEQMDRLLELAHVNIIYSFHSNGFKLKLLSALFNGRHCLVNPATINNTKLNNLCTVAATYTEIQQQILKLMEIEFTETDIQKRREVLENMFSNIENAKNIIQIIG